MNKDEHHGEMAETRATVEIAGFGPNTYICGRQGSSLEELLQSFGLPLCGLHWAYCSRCCYLKHGIVHRAVLSFFFDMRRRTYMLPYGGRGAPILLSGSSLWEFHSMYASPPQKLIRRKITQEQPDEQGRGLLQGIQIDRFAKQ